MIILLCDENWTVSICFNLKIYWNSLENEEWLRSLQVSENGELQKNKDKRPETLETRKQQRKEKQILEKNQRESLTEINKEACRGTSIFEEPEYEDSSASNHIKNSLMNNEKWVWFEIQWPFYISYKYNPNIT